MRSNSSTTCTATQRVSRHLSGDNEVLSTSWGVWLVSLINNLMLLAGAFGVLASSYWVRIMSTALSCILFVFLMLGFRVLFAYVLQRVVGLC